MKTQIKNYVEDLDARAIDKIHVDLLERYKKSMGDYPIGSYSVFISPKDATAVKAVLIDEFTEIEMGFSENALMRRDVKLPSRGVDEGNII